jgi:hypothetical protein
MFPNLKGSVLSFLTNISTKKFAGEKHSSLFILSINDGGKMFHNIDKNYQCFETFFVSLVMGEIS